MKPGELHNSFGTEFSLWIIPDRLVKPFLVGLALSGVTEWEITVLYVTFGFVNS